MFGCFDTDKVQTCLSSYCRCRHRSGCVGGCPSRKSNDLTRRAWSLSFSPDSVVSSRTCSKPCRTRLVGKKPSGTAFRIVLSPGSSSAGAVGAIKNRPDRSGWSLNACARNRLVLCHMVSGAVFGVAGYTAAYVWGCCSVSGDSWTEPNGTVAPG